MACSKCDSFLFLLGSKSFMIDFSKQKSLAGFLPTIWHFHVRYMEGNWQRLCTEKIGGRQWTDFLSIDERCELLFSGRASLHVIQVSHFRSNSTFIFNMNLSKMSVCVDNLKIARLDAVEWSTAHQSLTLMLHPWKLSGTNKLVVGMCISIYIYILYVHRYFCLATASAQPQPRCSCADHWGKKLTIPGSFAHQLFEACWSSSMFQPFIFGSVVTVVYITLFDINSN